MSLKIKRWEAALHLILAGHQREPPVTPLQVTPQFVTPRGHQTPTVANNLTPPPPLTTVLLPMVHHLRTSMVTRLLDMPQPGRLLILTRNRSQLV
jgi:hypothetical protein